ncbi:MAG: aminotransferase class IV [Alphaproteobacteria bacterium]|nr:aminotransferase class IV [Alphaproteobacteria bacterium]
MPEQIYLNGKFLNRQYAMQHAEDRGNQFADAIYDVVAVYHGRLVDEQAHLDRLQYSLDALGIEFFMTIPTLKLLIRDLLKRNRIMNGHVYIQISRGVQARNHAIPIPQPKAGLYMATCFIDYDNNPKIKTGIKVMSAADERWARPDIKSVGLLPNILAKSEAIKQGYHDVVFVDDNGKLREGSSNNFYAIKGKQIYQYPTDGSILAGITRLGVLSLIPQSGLEIINDGFPINQLDEIDEAFITSAGIFIMPIVQINQKIISNGVPGDYTKKLQASYHSYIMGFAQEIAV